MTLKIIPLNFKKKAQIGTTLTWFVGFVIIVFVMTLFLASTSLISSKKKIVSGSDEISFQKHLSNLTSQRMLFTLLNSYINFSDRAVKIKDILLETDMYNLDNTKKLELKEKIRNKTIEILNSSFDSYCYYFSAKYGIKDVSVTSIDPRGASYVASFIERSSLSFYTYDNLEQVDVRAQSSLSSAKQKLVTNSIRVIIPRNTNVNVYGVSGDYEKIIINFYGGNCL